MFQKLLHSRGAQGMMVLRRKQILQPHLDI